MDKLYSKSVPYIENVFFVLYSPRVVCYTVDKYFFTWNNNNKEKSFTRNYLNNDGDLYLHIIFWVRCTRRTRVKTKTQRMSMMFAEITYFFLLEVFFFAIRSTWYNVKLYRKSWVTFIWNHILRLSLLYLYLYLPTYLPTYLYTA